MTALRHTLTAVLLALAGCASSPNSVRTDVHCIEWHPLVVIGADGKVHVLQGGCKAWTVGPTPQERKDFDLRHGLTGEQP